MNHSLSHSKMYTSFPLNLKGSGSAFSSSSFQPSTTAQQRISRSYRALSSQTPLVRHVDTPSPLRRSSTLEGRPRYICITPSSTRERWLSRGISPSSGSSVSNRNDLQTSRQAGLPNSYSDGALMKKLGVNPVPRPQKAMSRNVPLRKSILLPHSGTPDETDAKKRKRYTQHVDWTPDLRPPHPSVAGSETLPPAPGINAKIATAKQTVKVQMEQPSPAEQNGQRDSYTDKEFGRSLKTINAASSALSSNSRASETVHPPCTISTNAKSRTEAESKPMTENRSSFAKLILEEEPKSPLIKPDGKVCEYPLNTWFLTSGLDNFGLNSEPVHKSRPYSFPPPNDFGLESLEEPPSPEDNQWSACNPGPENGAPHGLNELSQAADVISEQHHLAPARSRRRHRCRQGNAPIASTESMLNSSSGDTDSSASDKKAQSSKPDKSRAQEFRRTTPRQIKQHQQRHNTSGNFESKVSKPTSGTPEKGPQKFADQPNKPYPADLAASLIRTASLHLRSTLSRLKRSNSGHATTKGIVTDAPQIAATAGRRCSDPLKPETLENHKAPPISQNERKMDGKVIPQVTLVAGPKFVDNRTREPPKPDSSPLPPGYSRWSTRLGPPPPTVDESATKNVGNSVPLRRPEPPQTGDFKYVPPKPCNTSTPIVQLEKCPLWKSNSLAPVYHSLPTGEADDLNLLADDCADFGELGRINLRTGSFMGRYTQSRAQNTRPQFPSAQILYQRNLAPETTPNRLSPSRPLYLSPYQGTSSGNTTRSAPSPSLSSVTSAPGMSVQEPILARQKAVSLQSSRPNPDLLSPLPKNAPVSSAAPFVELDPVLTRLLLDVSSIDEYRSALRPQNIQTRSLSLNPNRISTTSEGPKSPSQSNVATSALSSALGSSDPGSMGLLGNQIPQESKQRTPSEELLEESWDLSQQINDLIQMEFACQAQRISPARALPKTRTMPTEHTRNGPRLSEPNVAVESDLSSPNGFGPGRRTRQHPFRWSSGTHHHQSSQKTHKLGSETAAPHVQKNRPGSTVLSRGIEAGSLDRGLQSGKHQQMFVSVEPLGGDVTDNSGLTNSQLSESVFYSTEGITGGGRRVSFWSLNTVQMAVLRKLSLVQITSFAEKHCTNRSPFNWRFLKYRAIGVTGDSLVQAISPTVSPTANKKIDIHVSEPSPPTNNDSGVHQENVHAAFSQSLSTALDRTPPVKPIDGDIHPPTPSRTAYTGPVFGQSLGNWQRRLGYPLPAAVVHMMNHLERIGTTAHGIFRRPGGKIRTQALREEIERDLTWNNFDDWQPYDVADLLKQFFRELPECLLTSKLSVVLVNLFNAVPESSQLDLLRWVVLGLPDENRVALQKLLYLLHSLLRYAHITQMSANNLAVCFAPSLFRLITSNTSVQSGVGLSPRRLRRTTSGPDPKDLADQRTAQLSLSAMITHAPSLFEISSDLLRRIHLAPPMNEPGELESIIPAGDWPSWIQTELRGLIRECSTSRPKGWSMPSRDAWKLYHSGSGAGESLDGLEVYFKKPVGTNENSTVPPLRTWRCSLPIPEPNPQEILGRFWNQRASWDPEITRIQVIEDISDSVDVCLMINTATFPQPNCGLHLLRGRQCVLEDGGSAMLSQSVAPICLVSGSNATTADTQLGSNPCGHVYEDHVYIKPLPDKSGCRVYLLSRVDLKGYSPDWYVNHWGHVLARRLLNLRRSFQPKNASFVGS